MHLDIVELIFKDQFLAFQENQIPYETQLSEINQVALSVGFRGYCGFYELDLIRWFLEIEELESKLQKRHNQHPNSPFCDYNNRQ